MSDIPVPAAAPVEAPAAPKAELPSILDVFLTFLEIGATSFGGGVVAYLRDALVRKKKWFDDVEFLELTAISNTLPGLNATNMAILAGDRLAGWPGASLAIIGMCVPAFIFMTAAGMVYSESHAPPARHRGFAAASPPPRPVSSRQPGSDRKEIAARVLRRVFHSCRPFWASITSSCGADHAACGRHTRYLRLSAAREHETKAEEQEDWIRSLH